MSVTSATAPVRAEEVPVAAGPGPWRRMRPFVLPVMGLLISLLFLMPYVVMLLDALRPSSDVLASPPSFWPKTWQWNTFGTVLGDARFLAWLKTSIIVATSSTAIVLVAAVPAAYFAARFRFPGRTAFLLLVLITQMFAPTALVVGIYREFFELNLVNTYLSIILTNSAFNLAFAIWILQGFFSSIPVEIEEAAHLDGASRFGTLWRMQDDDKKPLTVGISSYVTGYEQHWDELFAASLIAIVPVVILFIVIEKHLVGGLTAGSVK